jgi:hypothetical protein
MFGVVTRQSPARPNGVTAAIGMVALLGTLLGGCSSTSLSSIMGSKPAAGGAAANASAAADPLPPSFECPQVGIREGASTLSVSANPAEQTPVNMRYQVTIGQTARECHLVGQTVTMKVGIQGRVILGPAGAPGVVDVPLRLAVVKEGIDPDPIATKFQRLSVNVTEGNTNVLFSTVQDDISFPMPKGNQIDDYIVYVGFDPATAEEMDKGKKRPAAKKPAKPAKPRGTS